MVPGKTLFTLPVALARTNPVGMSPWSSKVVYKTKQLSSLAGKKRNTKTVLLPLGSRGYSRLNALFSDGYFRKRSPSDGIFTPLCLAGNKVEILRHIVRVRRLRDTSGGTSSSNRSFGYARSPSMDANDSYAKGTVGHRNTSI